MNAVLPDKTVCTVEMPKEVPPHRGLMLCVMERGYTGFTMRGEMDFDRELQPVRVGIPHLAFELWLPMLQAAVEVLTSMVPPVDPMLAEREAIIEQERLRLLGEGGATGV